MDEIFPCVFRALSEIKSYNEPPTVIATVIQVVMLMLGICGEEELQEWPKLKLVCLLEDYAFVLCFYLICFTY